MRAIYIWIIGGLVRKPEFPPLIVQLYYFQNTQTSTPYYTPTHPLFFLTIANHLITAFLYSTTPNQFTGLLTTLIVNDL